MAGEKTKTTNRARTRVGVKRDQSGDEDVEKKPDTPPKMKEKGSSPTLHPEPATSTAAERMVSGIEAIFRPIAKELIKGGIVLADNVSELTSETGEKFKDLLAEAKSELETSRPQAQKTNKTGGKGAVKD
jgi:hypothetical protein